MNDMNGRVPIPARRQIMQSRQRRVGMPLTPSLCQVNSHKAAARASCSSATNVVAQILDKIARRREGFKAAPFADALHDDP